jgi:polyphosphate kinase 2 (PPK2 family)
VRGHIRVRDGKRGTTHQVVVFLGVDAAGKRRYVRETVQSPDAMPRRAWPS